MYHLDKLLIISIVSTLCFSSCNSSSNQSECDYVDTDVTVDTTKIVSASDTIRYIHSPQDYIAKSKDYAKYAKGILPRMAKENPDYCRKLLLNEYDGFIVVDKRTMKVILYDKYGCERRSYPMACSRYFGTKHEKGDNRTPEGFFSVKKVYDSSDWVYVDDFGNKSTKRGEFGPRFIRLKIPVTNNIGIHGTAAPWSMGKRVSHGCIRITNENIMELVELVTPGMPVIISPGFRDRCVNENEGYNIAHITTEPYNEEDFENFRRRFVYKVKESRDIDTTETEINQPAKVEVSDPMPTDSI